MVQEHGVTCLDDLAGLKAADELVAELERSQARLEALGFAKPI